MTDCTRVIITLDGPAGTGKSTVAHGLSHRLGLDFLDTGAMYRAAALIACDLGIALADGAAITARLQLEGMRFDWTEDPPRVLVGTRDVSDLIRTPAVTAAVSHVAAQPAVRAFMVSTQQRIGREHPRLVTEGRDQGSIVFPDASICFYLDADVRERARRRTAQLVAAGKPADVDQIERDIATRDRLDASRPDGPLVRPEGAIAIDTGPLSAGEVIDRLEAIAREMLPEAGFPAKVA
jgi:cytidylate kinase